jgi:hypothetical protein
MIQSYTFGAIVIDGQEYSADLIVFPDKMNSSWWRKEGHKLSLVDLEDVFKADIEVLVIGTGFFGLMKVEPEVLDAARAKGLVLHIEKTKQAVQIYNQLVSRKKTAGAFHLTC